MLEVSPTASVRAMELITILNRCHRFPGFCLPGGPLQCRQEEHRSGRTNAQGFGRNLLAPPFAGARLRSARRRFEFIPLWGFLVFLLYTMRRVDCSRGGVVTVEEVPWGDGKRTLTKAYMLFLARWARRLSCAVAGIGQLPPE
jgi:hypothetical protein